MMTTCVKYLRLIEELRKNTTHGDYYLKLHDPVNMALVDAARG
jgi:hypothetical protein